MACGSNRDTPGASSRRGEAAGQPGRSEEPRIYDEDIGAGLADQTDGLLYGGSAAGELEAVVGEEHHPDGFAGGGMGVRHNHTVWTGHGIRSRDTHSSP